MSKESIDDLAIFGGAPACDRPLHVGLPNLGDRTRFLERVNDILDRRWLTNAGPYVREFERRVADIAGVRHCVATCNGTLALEIAIRALGLEGEVIVPAFTFIATAHALQWQEITPVFADIEPRTFNVDPASVERLITPRTTGIIGVHLWGRPCATEQLDDIARRHHLAVLYDASHAFGCSHQGRPIGSFGRAEVFSFHATKFVNTLEGGALVTNDDELARKARLMKNFGFVDYDKVSHVGSNGKMNEMSAAMGLTSLESMDDFIAANRRNYETYRRELAAIPGLSLLAFDERERCNFQYIVVDVDEREATIGRDALVKVLHAEHVLARRYFYPGCHRMEPYRSTNPDAGQRLPETERAAARVLSLPTGTGITAAEIAGVCQLLAFVVQHGHDIAARLATAPLAPGTPGERGRG